MKIEQLGKVAELYKDIQLVFRKISRRRRYQLCALLILQVIGAASEVVSIGAVLPFLHSLANANEFLLSPKLKPWLDYFGIESASELITLMALFFAFSIALANLFRILTLWVQSRFSAAIGSDFSTEIFRRMLFQSYEFHTNLNSGITISVITNDLGALMTVVRKCLMMIMQTFVVLSIMGALITYNIQVALTMIIILLGAYVFFARIGGQR